MEQSKLRSALSWADEVEKEEAEAEMARFRVQEKQKPNPFGSARPREVVLQERRQNMDPHLQSPPPPLSFFRNEFKENIPTLFASDADRKEAISPQLLSIFHHPQSAIFVPPLRYPPKNVVAAALFLNSHSFNIPQAQTQLKDGHCQSMEAAQNGTSCGEPADHGEQKSAYVGYKRKGFQGNWKNKDDDRREQRPRRPPLAEATHNRLHHNELNQNKSGFQNLKLCKNTAQWIVRGKKHPVSGGKQLNDNKIAEATHFMKMK